MNVNKALIALALGFALAACDGLQAPVEQQQVKVVPGELKRDRYVEICIQGVVYYYFGLHQGLAPAYEKSTVPVLRLCGDDHATR